MPPVPPRVSVITPARDAAATLPALLDALAAQGHDDFEVVLVDDGSTDATRAIASAHPVVTHVVEGEGRGPGAARNAGVAAAQGEILAFTDADCVPQPDWLQRGLEVLANADLVQGRVDPDGPVGLFDRTVNVPRLSPLFETANLLIRRETFDRAGGFEPWLAPRRSKELAEDVWLGWRARRAGARVKFADDAVVAHAVFPGTPSTFIAERARTRFFPAMTARIPELRDELLFKRTFLNRRCALFDLALAGVAVAAATRKPWALAAVVPYAREAWTGSPGVTVVHVTADAVGLAGLISGSIKAKTLVL